MGVINDYDVGVKAEEAPGEGRLGADRCRSYVTTIAGGGGA